MSFFRPVLATGPQARRVALASAMLSATSLGAQVSTGTSERPRPIQDNSFLLEEAYNQEARVVQHISGMMYQPGSRDWNYSFTQEWPVTGQRHQFSYTLVLAGAEGPLGARQTGLGDALLNYRFQLAGDGESKLAIAPRASLVVPTGDRNRGFGRGAMGLQVNLPASITLGDRLVTHINAGVTVTPNAWGMDGTRTALRDVALGQSVIWLAHPQFNVMTEGVWARSGSVAGARASYEESLVLSPGVRGAFNFASGLQVVPGIALPMELRATPRRTSVFSYLSFEHPF